MQNKYKSWLDSLHINGNYLTEEEVIKFREQYGTNEFDEKKPKPLIVKFLEEFKDLLIIILLIAAVISIIVDPKEWVESLIIFIVVILNAILGVYQENKAEKSLAALKKMSSPMSKVYRDGKLITIPSKELVVGDVIEVEAGDFIPADSIIIECSNLQVDESALTGESVPVSKISDDVEEEIHGIGDMKNYLFSSTYVTNGKAKALVIAVGMSTEIGKIAKALTDVQENKTPLQHKLDQVGKIIGIMALAICVVVFILNVFTSSPLQAFKIAISLAVAAIPEGLATVVTIVLAIGVKKMSQENAIVKRLPAVETLGSTAVICSDKTGTLTENRMTVVNLYLDKLNTLEEVNDDEKKLISLFAACCDASITKKDGNDIRIGDPTELALLDAAIKYNCNVLSGRVKDLPFDSDRKLMTVVFKNDGKYLSVTKGAVDVILSRSNNEQSVIDNALLVNTDLAKKAIRVLGLAVKEFDHLPEDDELEHDMNYVGLIGMIDPARKEVKSAIAVAKRAGMMTVMITGDHVVTAKAIAEQLGIISDSELAISSSELANISDEDLINNIEKYRVYARVSPSDKQRIVNAWQTKGYVVAMTGDGVNDAPALKMADIGCAMGITGTDVSKEAADMILTDDNFTTIISAVKEGRGIYDNIKKCVTYLLSSNIGEVITIFIASILALFGSLSIGAPLSPIHLLWINLITDSLPSFGLGMEKPEEEIMSKKPRDKKEGFFSGGLIYRIVLIGSFIGLLTLASYLVGLSITNNNHTVAQTMAFFTLSSVQLLHSFNMKSHHSLFSKKTFNNSFLLFSFVIGYVLQFFVIYCPGIRDVFKLYPLTLVELSIAFGISLLIVVFMEIVKAVNRSRK